VASYDFAHTREETRDDKILNLLAFLLAGPRREFGQLAFPRLYATFISLASAPDKPQDRLAAVQEIQRALEDPSRVAWVQSVMESLAEDATNLLPSLPGGKPPGSKTAQVLAPGIVLAALRRTRWLSPRGMNSLGPWPGMIVDPARRGIDEMAAVRETLATMQVYRGSGQTPLLSQAEQQQWAAFLQDIRTGYPRHGRNLCTFLLLHNVDLPAGKRFLRALTDACDERRQRYADDVPLLVIASGSQPVTDDCPRWEVEIRHPPDLSPLNVRDLAMSENVPGIAAVEEAVPALSSGHRGIAKAMLKRCARSPTYPYAITPGVRLREELLPNVDDADFENLVSCALAIDVDQVERVIFAAEAPQATATEDGSPVLPGRDLRRLLGGLGWLRGTEIHPGIRTLLLRHLAKRPGTHEWPWKKACEQLRDQPPARLLVTSRPPSPGWEPALRSPKVRAAANNAYYDLAAGKIAAAVEALESIGTEAPEWTAAFDWITSAPQPNPISEAPRQLAKRLARAAINAGDTPGPDRAGTAQTDSRNDPHARLTRLVVACWLAADRQLDPWHELDQDIADCYREVRPLGGELFVTRARHYEDEADRWRRSERDRHPRPKEDHVP
jgi:hypothetical protein